MFMLVSPVSVLLNPPHLISVDPVTRKLRVHPDQAFRVWVELGNLYLDLHDWAGAKGAYAHALAVDPWSAGNVISIFTISESGTGTEL